MCRSKRWTCIALTLLTVFNGSNRIASAGRIQAELPLLQFEHGYGVVAAQVVEARQITGDGEYPTFYDMSFRVHQIVAQPLTGTAFSFRPGDLLKIPLSAGYGCQIEHDWQPVFAAGRSFYLIIRRDEDGTFVHAGGGSAMRPVEKFDAAEDQFYARVRDLAATPADRRLVAFVNVVKSPTEPERLRSEALFGVSLELLRVPGQARDGRAAEVRRSLLGIWNDPDSKLSLNLLQELDQFLQGTDPKFVASTERRDVWLKNLLAPNQQRTSGEEIVACSILRRLAQQQPAATGRQLAAHLLKKDWPPMYRRAIASGLLTSYRYADQVDLSWEPTLQSYFIELFKDGQPFPIRVSADDLQLYATLETAKDAGARRRYLPDAKVKEAIRTAIPRLKALNTNPDPNFNTRELTDLLKFLDEPSESSTPPK